MKRGEAEDRFQWRPRQVADLLRLSAKEFLQDKAPRHAAALAYYSLFAIGPLLLIAVSIAGLVFGAEAARAAVVEQVGRLVGRQGAEGLESLMAARSPGRAGWGLALGVGLLLVGAAGVFGQLRDSLNAIWEVEVRNDGNFRQRAMRMARRNFLSFATIVGLGFLLLVSLAVSAGLAALSRYAEGLLPGGSLLWGAINFVVSLALVSVLFGFIFRVLPETRVDRRDVMVGAVVTALLFVVGELLIGLYLGQAATASRYGAAGSVIVLLLWVYYSGLILFFGAELTQVYANRFGGHVRPTSRAETVQKAAQRNRHPSEEGTQVPAARADQGRSGEHHAT
ncbi:MAG TPA: YihY/virulence factor BrkB family protein [Candidatus Thermoplasmatota archaeon]|nr:YihY/virulence factor BrkB family protein [Candidatus Thermoplasmatota archaeon]